MENYKHIVTHLSQNKLVFEALVRNTPQQERLWKPAEDSWCLLEVLCHLLDEEKLDFRFRAKFVLEHPGEVPPPFDPTVWVTEHDYMNKDFENTLDAFLEQRDNSIAWLDSLEDPDWTLSFDHPKLGKMTAGYFLANWLAHDYLHIRQVNKIKYEYYRHKSDMNLDYAGNW